MIRSITRYAYDKGVILLAQGFPDFDPPQEVITAAEQAMRSGRNQYGMTWGQPSLRKAIAEKSRRFYDGLRHIPIATLPGMQDRAITICGLGKTFAVTGWRVGYAIANEDLTDALRKVHDFTTVCAPTPLKEAMASVIGLPDTYYEWPREFYASRRSRMLGILDSHDFKYAVPEGAYYVMADFRHLGRGDDDMAFAYWLIDEIGVATVPGSNFYSSDPRLGRGLVRFAFPKKDATFDFVEERFEKLKPRR